MSKDNEVLGQIKINFREKGKPEVIITGDVKSKRIPLINRAIQVAYRQHKLAITRAKKVVDMADKGKKQVESQQAEPSPSATGNIFEVDEPAVSTPAPQEELVVEDALEEVEEAPAKEEVPKAPVSSQHKLDQ